MTEKGPVVAACVPAFNEEGTIARVVLMAERYVDRVVVCDDGSVDLTGAIAEGLGAVVIRHERKREYRAYDINDSVPTIGVGKGNV
jgi:glycosyltransferase involved in cell wall biosynthesis